MYTTAYTNQIAGDVMSTVIPYLTQFEEMISSFFPDIMPVADLYASVTNYTTYSCPLKWIVRTRGRYVYYYTEIQTRINDTRDTVLANYTYWSDRFMTLGDSLDADVTELLEILTENGCDSDFQTSFIDSLQQNITISINAINNLYQYYTMISPVSASLAYAFPNELIKALQRQSIMNFGDLGRAVHYVSHSLVSFSSRMLKTSFLLFVHRQNSYATMRIGDSILSNWKPSSGL